MRHHRSVAYSVELVLLNKHQVYGGAPKLHWYHEHSHSKLNQARSALGAIKRNFQNLSIHGFSVLCTDMVRSFFNFSILLHLFTAFTSRNCHEEEREKRPRSCLGLRCRHKVNTKTIEHINYHHYITGALKSIGPYKFNTSINLMERKIYLTLYPLHVDARLWKYTEVHKHYYSILGIYMINRRFTAAYRLGLYYRSSTDKIIKKSTQHGRISTSAVEKLVLYCWAILTTVIECPRRQSLFTSTAIMNYHSLP